MLCRHRLLRRTVLNRLQPLQKDRTIRTYIHYSMLNRVTINIKYCHSDRYSFISENHFHHVTFACVLSKGRKSRSISDFLNFTSHVAMKYFIGSRLHVQHCFTIMNIIKVYKYHLLMCIWGVSWSSKHGISLYYEICFGPH